MKLLFLHHNYPAQFGPLLQHRRCLGDEIVFVSERYTDKPSNGIKHLTVTANSNLSLSNIEGQLDCSQRFLAVLVRLRDEDWIPDIIISHSGWGCGLWAKYVFPTSRLISYLEWWFKPGFWNDLSSHPDSYLNYNHISAYKQYKRNLSVSLELLEANAIVSPTYWQRAQAPTSIQSCIQVIHEGVDINFYRPNPRWKPKDRLRITYVSRGFEPIRCFHYFIRALPKVLKQNSKIEVFLAGEDRICYGGNLPCKGLTWQQWASGFLQTYIDGGRVHFLGRLQNPNYARLLKSSHLHCYFTQPFVVSWSLVEAMASGCAILTSDNVAVKEVAGSAASYCDHADNIGLSKSIEDLLDSSSSLEGLSKASRQRCEDKFSRASSLKKWDSLMS